MDEKRTDGTIGFLCSCVLLLSMFLAYSLDKLDRIQMEKIKLEARLEFLLLQQSDR